MPLKNKTKSGFVKKVSRKQLRKDKRKEKKVKRNDYFTKFKKPDSAGDSAEKHQKLSAPIKSSNKSKRKKQTTSERKPPKVLDGNKVSTIT